MDNSADKFQEIRSFVQSQIGQIENQIKQAKIMQKAWMAGGESFAQNLEQTTKGLGSLIAVKESLETQLAEYTDA